jgi:hypothetical protein
MNTTSNTTSNSRRRTPYAALAAVAAVLALGAGTALTNTASASSHPTEHNERVSEYLLLGH